MSAEPGPDKTIERQIRAFHWVRLLAEIPARHAGTAAERDVAERIAGWLRDELAFGEVGFDRVPSRPRTGAVLALHLFLGALACALGGGVGLVLALLAGWSFRHDVRGARRVLSRLLPAPDSLNVVARAGAQRPRSRVVLSAHIDSPQAGWLFSPRVARLFARRARPRPGRDAAGAPKPPPGPHALPLALLTATAAVLAAAWLGASGWLVAVALVALGGACLVGFGAALQWAVADPSPGANDNGSAVAAMLTCAEQLLATLPDDAELWVVGTGAEEVGCCGMYAFLEEHREWPRGSTFFVNFECVGGGELHWVASEGTLQKTAYPPTLVEISRRVAASGLFGEVTSTHLLAGTDGHVPADRGFPTLSLVSLEDDGIPRNYHRAQDLPDALDMALVVRAADFGAAVARAAWRGEAGPIAIL